ncbi:MAG: hypothetical protein RR614_05250 [Eubacterium sp.]
MKNYRIFSKIGLCLCVCGIIAVIFNHFTGFINPAITTNGGSFICGMLLTVAIIQIIVLEKERMKKSKY